MNWFKESFRLLNHVSIEFKKNETSRYISDFISTDTIRNWNHTTPVFISAQTGSGKSFFIQNVLLDMLVDEDPKQKNAVLLLSNRIALNRQFKIQLADNLVSLTGDVEYKKVMEQCYTFKGVDKFCYQFGIITACSYHQLLENKSIELSRYKYIICDTQMRFSKKLLEKEILLFEFICPLLLKSLSNLLFGRNYTSLTNSFLILNKL